MKKVFALPSAFILVWALAFAMPSGVVRADCAGFPGNMYKGVTNSALKTAQDALISQEYLASGNNTGYFGAMTQAAVQKFQVAKSLTVSGFIDQVTWQNLVGCNGGGQQPVTQSGSGDLYIPGILGIGTKGKYNSIIRSASDSNLYFQTGYSPTTQMVIDPNGNVGIGTLTPGARLEVYAYDSSNASTGGELLLSSNGNPNRETKLSFAPWIGRPGGTAAQIVGKDDGNYSANIIFRTATPGSSGSGKLQDRMVITSSGSVGIGISNPQAGLHIDRGSTNSAALELSSSGAGFGSGMLLVNSAANQTYSIYANNSGALVFGDEVQKQPRMWIEKTKTVIEPNSANVGIGTSNPTQKLEVNGYVKAKGYITGDMVFQQNGQTLWTMSEQPDGLYLKSALTGKLYKLQMTEVQN